MTTRFRQRKLHTQQANKDCQTVQIKIVIVKIICLIYLYIYLYISLVVYILIYFFIIKKIFKIYQHFKRYSNC